MSETLLGAALKRIYQISPTQPSTLGHETSQSTVVQAVWNDDCSQVVQPTSLHDDLSTRPMYRVFHRGRFHFPCTGAETINRLFSHVQVQALNITHAILMGPTSTVMTDGFVTECFSEPKATAAMLTSAERDSVEMLLDEIITHLNIGFGETGISDADARTVGDHDQKLPTMPGIASIMVINQHFIDDIETAFAENNIMAQQYHMFALVRVLTHEFAHVLDMAARTAETSHNGAFLGSTRTEEVGFEFENKLFGGIITAAPHRIIHSRDVFYTGTCQTIGPDGTKMDGQIVSHEWPVQHIVDFYKALPNKTFCTQGPPLPPIWRDWKVPFGFITRLFQDEFWNDPTLPGNERALHPRRTAGFLKQYGEGVAFDVSPGDPRAEEYLPDGFEFARCNGSLLMLAKSTLAGL